MELQTQQQRAWGTQTFDGLRSYFFSLKIRYIHRSGVVWGTWMCFYGRNTCTNSFDISLYLWYDRYILTRGSDYVVKERLGLSSDSIFYMVDSGGRLVNYDTNPYSRLGHKRLVYSGSMGDGYYRIWDVSECKNYYAIGSVERVVFCSLMGDDISSIDMGFANGADYVEAFLVETRFSHDEAVLIRYKDGGAWGTRLFGKIGDNLLEVQQPVALRSRFGFLAERNPFGRYSILGKIDVERVDGMFRLGSIVVDKGAIMHGGDEGCSDGSRGVFIYSMWDGIKRGFLGRTKSSKDIAVRGIKTDDTAETTAISDAVTGVQVGVASAEDDWGTQTVVLDEAVQEFFDSSVDREGDAMGYAVDGCVEIGGYEIDGGYLYCLFYGEEIA